MANHSIKTYRIEAIVGVQISLKHMGRDRVEFRYNHRTAFQDRLGRLFRNSAGQPREELLA